MFRFEKDQMDPKNKLKDWRVKSCQKCYKGDLGMQSSKQLYA